MTGKLLCTCFGLFACVPAARAAELVVRTVGLDLQYLMQDYDYTISDATGDRTGSNSFDSGYEVALTGRWGFTDAGDSHGWIVGGDLGYAMCEGESLSLQTYGVSAVGGYAYAFSDSWTLQATGHVSYGAGSLDVEGGSRLEDVSGSGTWFGYGAEAGISHGLTERLLVSLEAGYEEQSGTYDLDGIDTDLDISGLRVALGFTWRFSIAPPPLE